MNELRQDIAVIGAGVAGICAAYLLSDKHNVTLFEKNEYLGGHTNTRIIEDGEDSGTPIDTGFIVCNHRNYTNFYKFLNRLNVPLRDSDMSFGYYCDESRLQYVGPSIIDFLKSPKNLFNKNFVSLIKEQRRFNRSVLYDLNQSRLNEVPLQSYLKSLRVDEYFIRHYLTPLIASVWSSPDIDTLEFPMKTFATFFNNHGMLEMRHRPMWQTIIGGSHTYVDSFKKVFKGQVLLKSKIRKVSRNTDKIIISTESGQPYVFNKVIFATHADEALQLLSDPTPEEISLLSLWNYNRNLTILHTDTSVMHGPKRLWASWNYRRSLTQDKRSPVAITYYMNRLQGLKTKNNYFVTLNPKTEIDNSRIIYSTEYTHPIYTSSSIVSQDKLRSINGENSTYFCGAYLGYGFHEDAVRSAVEVAKDFGCSL